jgi:glycosyltransferase involved in cell wall biosynthesis
MADAQGLTVSVIVIVRNGARFIGKALASITRSRTQPIEILVIDGGSTDGSADIARAMPGVTVMQQMSSGIAAAYNQGIACARGCVLAFLSSDDVWLPGKLDRHVQALQDDPELLLSVCMMQHFLEPGHVMPAGFRPELLTELRPGLVMEALVARRSAFDLVGLFDPTLSTAEDTDWFARARDAGLRIAVLPEVLLRKRVHGANASLIDPDGHRHRLRVLRASLARKRAAKMLPA